MESLDKIFYLCYNRDTEVNDHGTDKMTTRTYWNLESAKEYVSQFGFTLVANNYIKAADNFQFICPNGHQYQATFKMFLRGNRCAVCSQKAKPDFDFIKSEFEAKGYTLLSKEYVNQDTKLEVLCPKGHHHSLKWNHFYRSGVKCPHCTRKVKITIEQARDYFASQGYILNETEYINCETHMSYTCPKGHNHIVTWDKFANQGRRCPSCMDDWLIDLRNTPKSDPRYFATFTISKINKRIKSWLKIDTFNICNHLTETAIEELVEFYRRVPKDCHVDHIIPFSWFDLTKSEEISACWCVSNLRYLKASKNLQKCNRITVRELLDNGSSALKIVQLASYAPIQELEDLYLEGKLDVKVKPLSYKKGCT